MPLMAKKKPKTDQTDTPPGQNRRGAALHVWLDPAIMKAIDKYMESLKHPTTKTAVTEAALKGLLKAEGFWPPSEQDVS